MAPQAVQNSKDHVWRVSRCFEGDRNPEELLRALIQAHRR